MTKYLNNLTPMRGIAALLTVFFHFDLMLGNGGGGIIATNFSPIMGKMYLMVDFFFILSGFIMSHVYSEMFSTGVTFANYKTFFQARFARLYPLHLATLLFCIALYSLTAKMGIAAHPILEAENNFSTIISNLFMVHSLNLHDWFSWNHASWSISVEWATYMIFPFLVIPFMKMNNWLKIATIVACFIAYIGIALYLVPMVNISKSLFFLPPDLSLKTINVSFQYGIFRCLAGFILGMAGYELYRVDWLKKYLSNGYLIITFALLSFVEMHLQLPDYVIVIPFLFIILAGAYGSEGINHFFANKSLQHLGDWSFTIYMIHEPVMYMVNKIFVYSNALPNPRDIANNWLIIAWHLPLILLFSYLTYRFFEVPVRKWINPAKVNKS